MNAVEQAQELVEHLPVKPSQMLPRDGCKPCGCGKPDCIVVQREDEGNHAFRKRRFASRACWPCANDAKRGALIATLDWLNKAPPGRIAAQRRAEGLSP